VKVGSATRPHGWLALGLAGLVAAAVWQVLVVRNDLRLLTVIAGALALLLLCLWRPRATLVLMTMWLPFSGLIRRLLDPGGDPGADPFLMLVPAVSLALVMVAAWAHQESAATSFRSSTITWLVTLLMIVLALEVLNPIQGSLLVGLGGTVFLFFPMLWFFLGRTYFDAAFVDRLLSLVAAIGLVSALYGGFQAVYGVAPFEARWVASRDFASLNIGRFLRPFSTFANPEEWSRYSMVAATIGLGRWFERPGRWWWLGLAAACSVAVALSGVRISAFGLLLSIGALLVLAGTTRPSMAWRVGVPLIGLVAYVLFAPAASPMEERASDVAWDAFFGHTTRGVLAPLEEDTFWIRVDLWWELFTNVVPRYPLGMGLGVPTLGAWRFASSLPILTESYAVAIFVAAGLLGGGLVFWLFGAITRAAVQTRRSTDTNLQIVGAVLIGIIFTSLFGNSLSLYAVGPLSWGLIGWLSTRESRSRDRSRIGGNRGA
jgi:hypothetical protein